MFMSYFKYNEKTLRVLKSLGAICLFKISVEIWKVDWRGSVMGALP